MLIMYTSTCTCALYKKKCNATYMAQSVNLYLSFKKYIDKIYALCNSQFLKN